ncbi:heparan-alpha-glucosaminide N-acetyltransferase domain-containing protein [Arthrobacter sp. ZGTC412]|uniref:heparan-alpha-glucosaminide N-acetyltransferase domain-containing protein n=1 Tax=Arthrobacter sp. ZGTC412 TaxID=2058900 RepID=UPI000CE50322|nr:heparan-alpha-glucosaminide N-acetyltransferase domain-containing protein [Arthrobacter sp. ZGTC412]
MLKRTKRAIGVDVARAIALIGMVAVHGFGRSDVSGEMTWAFAIFGGRAAALFALLAGVSIAFVERRSRGQLFGRTLWADRAALVVRGLLILLAGLLLGYMGAPLETILPYFGILLLLAIPFYGRSSRLLIVSALLFAIVGPILLHLFGGRLPEQPDPTSDYTLVDAFKYPVPFVWDMLLTGFYPTLLWMAYICAGIVIGRQVLTSRKVALAIAGWGAGLAITAWSLSHLLLGPLGGMQRLAGSTPDMTSEDIIGVLAFGPEETLMPDTTWWWLTAVSPYSNTPFNVLHNLGAAMALLGVVLLLTHSGARIFSPFAAFGAMTLTLYSAHVILLSLDILDANRPLVGLWIQIISFMLFALVWRSSIGRGPLELIISDSSDWVRTKIRAPGPRIPGWLKKRRHPGKVAAARPGRQPGTVGAQPGRSPSPTADANAGPPSSKAELPADAADPSRLN